MSLGERSIFTRLSESGRGKNASIDPGKMEKARA
jgi:hypothetical protein